MKARRRVCSNDDALPEPVFLACVLMRSMLQ